MVNVNGDKHSKVRKLGLFIILCCLFLFSNSGLACNVPVFRYALERWPAENYEVFIFHHGPLSAEDKLIINWLKESSNSKIPYSNYNVHTFDLSTRLEGYIRDIWDSLDSPELPCMAVFYPNSFLYGGNIWYGGLAAKDAKELIKSPVRTEIARRILNGESAVWIFLESGDTEKDNAAADMLQTQLKKLENSLKLPIISSDDIFNDFVNINENGPELQVVFSMIPLSRSDPAESYLINMLMKSEPDLFEYISYPMAFPVYGRGRVLYTLIGNGINERVIQKACEFIIGPCSCIIKAQNPGVDLLMMTNWEASLQGRWVENVELPTLTSLSELASITAEKEVPETDIEKMEVDELPNQLSRNIILIFVIIIVSIIILSLNIKRFYNKENL